MDSGQQYNINPNVVLTADNSQYDAAMSSSAALTDRVSNSIDSLTAKISKLTKVSGKSLIGISAADTATIAGATAAWASYEKQVERLRAQAATLSRSQANAANDMRSYAATVSQLRGEFGTTTAAAAQLTLVLSKMSDSTTPIKSLGVEFTKMANATGEASDTLASSLLNLQKIMGTPQTQTKAYADQLTTLAASANTTASALADFSSQIAPIGRTLGMSQTAVTGISKAFVSAGQDGYRAATAFNKIMSDIAYASSTGSPDLSKYANLIGVTVKQFQALSGQQKAVDIFDALNRLGPKAVVQLNQMGLDGVNTLKAITAMSQQSGGLGTAIQQAQAAYGDGSVQRGSAASMDDLTTSLSKLRQELQMTAESFGAAFGPMVKMVVDMMDKVASAIHGVMDGPIGDMIKGFAALVAPVAAAGGALLLMAGALLKLSGAALLWRNSGMLGFREGFKGANMIRGSAELDSNGKPLYYMGSGTTRGNQIAERGSAFQRFVYNGGIYGSQAVQKGFNFVDEHLGNPSTRLLPGEDPASRTGFLFRQGSPMAMTLEDRQAMNFGQRANRFIGSGIYSVAGFNRNLITPALDPLRYPNPADRHLWMGPGGSRVPINEDVINASRGVNTAKSNLASLYRDPHATDTELAAAEKALTEATAKLTASEEAAIAVAKSLNEQQMVVAEGFKGIGVASRQVMASFGEMATAFAETSAQVVRSGFTMAGKAGGALVGALGGPMNAAIMGSMIAIPIIGMIKDHFTDHTTASFTNYAGAGTAYMKAAGINAPSQFNQQYVTTLSPTGTATPQAQLYATSNTYQPVDPHIQGLKTTSKVMAYLGPLWANMKKNPTAVQGAVNDMLNAGFSMSTINNQILPGLNKGNYPGIGTFANQVVQPGLSNQSAGFYLSHALGMSDDIATQISATQGPAAGSMARAEQTAQLLAGLGTAPGQNNVTRQFTGAAAGAFNSNLADLMFGGASLSNDQIARLFYTITPGTSRGPKLTKPIQSLVDAAKNGVNSPGAAADQLTGYIQRARAQYQAGQLPLSQYTKITTGLLSYNGVSDAQKYANPDQSISSIRAALLDVFTQAKHEQQNAYEALGSHISDLGGAAKLFGDSVAKQSGAINKLLSNIESPLALSKAITEQANAQGVYTDPAAAITRLINIRTKVGSNDQPASQVAQALQDQANQVMGWQQQFMTNPQAFSSRLSQGMSVMQAMPSDASAAEQTAGRNNVIQTMVDQAAQIKQNLMTQIQFNLSQHRAQADYNLQTGYGATDFALSQSRATQDFNLQKQYSAHDYALSRSREDQDYNIQRTRAEYQFHLQMMRNLQDYNIQRKRNEQDYQHSVMLMIQQQSEQMYNMYDRVKVAQTDSATYLLLNSQQQTQLMQQQEGNLQKLRGMGLSGDVIKQMGFTSTDNAQQLSRFVAEVANDPTLIQEFNKQVADRIKAAAALTKDKSSSDWQEFQRQYKLSRDRAQADFQRSVERARSDFNLQMTQSEQDFQRSMERQAQDYQTAQDRANTSFHISMDRAATDYSTTVDRMRTSFNLSMQRAQKDMNVMANGVQGTIAQVMEQGAQDLTGALGKQAQASLKTFQSLGKDFGTQGWDIMKMMAQMFGFKVPPKPNLNEVATSGYTAPSSPVVPTSGSGSGGGPKGSPGHPGLADGGVLPGFTPGRDVHVFHSRTAGDIALSGGEGIMRPEWVRAHGGAAFVDAENRKAKYGHYSGGGIYRPVASGGITQGAHDIGAMGAGSSAIDFGVPIGTPVHAVAPGNVIISKDLIDSAGNYYSYGKYIEIQHKAFASLYAHLSQRIAQMGAGVAGGQIIGLSGNTGNVLPHPTAANPTAGAHLHFGVQGANPFSFVNASTNYGKGGSFIGPFLSGGGSSGNMNSILDKTYPKLESDAAHFMNGMIPPGHLSKMLNNWARAVAAAHGGMAAAGGGGAAAAPSNISGNVALGKRLAAGYGWGQGNEWNSLYQLWNHESGWDSTIHYGGGHGYVPGLAYGIPQALPGSKMATAGSDWQTNPATQIKWGLGYIKSQYGDPATAWNFDQTHNGYGKGGVFAGARNVTVGETGPETVLPLNNYGAQFMADTLSKFSTGTSARAHGLRNAMPMSAGGGMSIHNYHVDRSTQFSGPITVQANNPGELVSQLQARQRVMALTNPVRGGARV